MIRFTVDTSEVSAAEKSLALLIGKYDKITAIAMSRAAASAKDRLSSNVIPRIRGGATNWTTRGLRYWRADRDRLVAAVGWNYGDNSPTDIGLTPKGRGVPSGRYMEVLSRGGDRRPKSAELSMRRAGVIRKNQFITPATGGRRGDGVTLSPQGNLAGSEYKRILSRIKASGGDGSTSSATSSKRSRRRRAQSDYFVRYGGLGEGAMYVAKRIGRGFIPALFVVDQPNYERKFDIQGIAWNEYRRVFPGEFRRALWAQQARVRG